MNNNGRGKMEGGKTSNGFWQRALLINPYYFALLLFGMFAMNIYHVVSLEKAWTLSPIYFLAYALIESLFEVLALVFVGNIIKSYLPKFFYYSYVSLCFLFFTLHYVDFVLVRYMDISVYYGLHWVFDESLDNFIELLHLTGISISSWIFILTATLLFIPIISMILYHFTGKLAAKKSIKVTQKGLFKVLCFLPMGLLALDMTVTPKVERQEYHFYQRMLPWKSTLLSKKEVAFKMGSKLKELPDETGVLKKVHSVPVTVTKKPNIYLFVVESLRQDFLSEKTARHLAEFRDQNLTFKKTYSSANATQISWYSIFHSNYPLYWAEAKKKWQSGSVPLQILKKMGYKIHVYSAAQLKYYGLEDVMFGRNHYLTDSHHVFPHYYPTQAWESDQRAVDTFLGDLEKKKSKEGNVFVFFLEGTHFNYSWPDSYPTHFEPISEEKTHLRVSNSLKNIELIKNRYRNSIHYMDHLFGKVMGALKEKGLYDEGVVIFTGDHGEEFFEEGQLFHASHLSAMQTEPPIYMKLGNNQRARECEVEELVTSHVDIFPTVLDYLMGKEMFGEVLDGESIFKRVRKDYVVTGRFNGPRQPGEFFISNGEEKCIFRLHGKKKLEVRNFQGEISSIKEHFGPALDNLFQ
ncbi:MAG: sulfatase-like hydrolase/transferase [Chlamydiales bacterium]|nr:sulfatase-like hydrolase/transferase [Chlamydiales bacterium]